jgi:hypothetical protein
VTEPERTSVDQLIELIVYAPIGLLYERDEVVPRLVRRGRSQVQLARVLGQLAVRRGQTQLEDRVGDVVGVAGGQLARAVTELGSRVGLAPPGPSPAEAPPQTEPVVAATGPDADVAPAGPLPIARYDELRARDIIPLLGDLTPRQRRVVRDHEVATRGRKTVLYQIDQLGI